MNAAWCACAADVGPSLVRIAAPHSSSESGWNAWNRFRAPNDETGVIGPMRSSCRRRKIDPGNGCIHETEEVGARGISETVYTPQPETAETPYAASVAVIVSSDAWPRAA